jgi:hypothetical protein
LRASTARILKLEMAFGTRHAILTRAQARGLFHMAKSCKLPTRVLSMCVEEAFSPAALLLRMIFFTGPSRINDSREPRLARTLILRAELAEDHLDEAERGFRQRFIFPVNQP